MQTLTLSEWNFCLDFEISQSQVTETQDEAIDDKNIEVKLREFTTTSLAGPFQRVRAVLKVANAKSRSKPPLALLSEKLPDLSAKLILGSLRSTSSVYLLPMRGLGS